MKTVLKINRFVNVDDGGNEARRGTPVLPRRACLGPPDLTSFSPRSWRTRHKRLKRWTVYAAVVTATGLMAALPLSWALGLGAWGGRVAYRWDRRRAARARLQIEAALGVGMGEAARLARQSYAHLGQVIVELAVANRRPIEAWVDFPDAHRRTLEAAVNEGRGVVVVTGHIGNWELLARRVTAAGFDGTVVVRSSNNPYLGRWLATWRAASGLRVIERGAPDSPRRMLAALRRGGLLGLLIDQRTNVPSVDVPFFGRRAATPVAAAALALRRACPVVVATIARQPNGRHRLAVERIALPSSGSAQHRRLALTARLTAALEDAIRSHPAQWPWFHERWGG